MRIEDVKTGMQVFWKDPEGKTSGEFEVYSEAPYFDSDSVILIGDGVSEVEVTADEIEPMEDSLFVVLLEEVSVDSGVSTASVVEVCEHFETAKAIMQKKITDAWGRDSYGSPNTGGYVVESDTDTSFYVYEDGYAVSEHWFVGITLKKVERR